MNYIYYYGFPILNSLLLLYLLWQRFFHYSITQDLKRLLDENFKKIEDYNQTNFLKITNSYAYDLKRYLQEFDLDSKSEFQEIQNNIDRYKNDLIELKNLNFEIIEKLKEKNEFIQKQHQEIQKRDAIINRKKEQIDKLKKEKNGA